MWQNEDPQALQIKRLFSYGREICSDMLEICKPLFETLKLTYFGQTRAFRDGSYTAILTNVELGEHWVANQYTIPGSNKDGIYLAPGCYLASTMKELYPLEQHQKLRELFNVDHALFIVDKHADYDDIYMLATNPENEKIINIYLNQMDLIKRFLLYYQDKSSGLIRKAQDSKIILPKSMQGTDVGLVSQLCKEKFYQQTASKKILLKGYSGDAFLSEREMTCLIYLKKGLTIKEIAKLLTISPRTVETYLARLKFKLGCEKKSELFGILEQQIY